MSNIHISEKQVWEQLKTVIDPELSLDVVSLGFIYDVQVKDDQIKINYSLTTPGCPLANFIAQNMRQALSELVDDPNSQIELRLVFDPAWTPDMMSQEAKKSLGYNEEQ
jgi:metal-sulfur cluster biosynthetic enzyme